MTRKRIPILALLAAVALPACGNYSNEDLEFMNAIPTAQDVSAEIPRSAILPANQAELARDTHATIDTFNASLKFLELADAIRSYPPTSRIPNGRVWGPARMEPNHLDWQWRFRITRDPAAPEMFTYWFEIQPAEGGDVWSSFIDGSFAATGGVRKGLGHFRVHTDEVRAAGFMVDVDAEEHLLNYLDCMYSTAAFPVSVTTELAFYPNPLGGDFTNMVTIHYHYEAQETGQGAMEFSGSDSVSGYSLSVVSRWLPTGAGRAEATLKDTANAGMTWYECWDVMFRSTYDDRPWEPSINHGDEATDCPAI